jgi:hypothetical protein
LTYPQIFSKLAGIMEHSIDQKLPTWLTNLDDTYCLKMADMEDRIASHFEEDSFAEDAERAKNAARVWRNRAAMIRERQSRSKANTEKKDVRLEQRTGTL